MNLRLDQPGSAPPSSPDGFPTASELAALRAWYQGLDTREAVARYLDDSLITGSTARSVIRNIRNQLREFARLRLRPDLANLIGHKDAERTRLARSVFQAIETLRASTPAMPHISDAIERWLAPQAVEALHAYGIRTLTDLTVRIARRKMWWINIPGLGRTGACQIEVFFAQHTALTERARDLVILPSRQEVVPWEIFTP
ncbi:MAG: integrase, partial [Proteobacteria bacterium]